MGIVGIENRTENWRTVQHFGALSEDAKVRLVKRLAPQDTAHGVRMELFWYGVRDYVYKNGPVDDDLVRVYRCHFEHLRDQISEKKRTQDAEGAQLHGA